VEFWQTVLLPVIAPGITGIDVTVTFKLRTCPVPHEFLEATDIVPPLAPVVTDIDSEVEMPLQPDGSVHIYEVAPGTGDIL
jgi:hypothetical protein